MLPASPDTIKMYRFVGGCAFVLRGNQPPSRPTLSGNPRTNGAGLGPPPPSQTGGAAATAVRRTVTQRRAGGRRPHGRVGENTGFKARCGRPGKGVAAAVGPTPRVGAVGVAAARRRARARRAGRALAATGPAA